MNLPDRDPIQYLPDFGSGNNRWGLDYTGFAAGFAFGALAELIFLSPLMSLAFSGKSLMAAIGIIVTVAAVLIATAGGILQSERLLSKL